MNEEISPEALLFDKTFSVKTDAWEDVNLARAEGFTKVFAVFIWIRFSLHRVYDILFSIAYPCLSVKPKAAPPPPPGPAWCSARQNMPRH